MSPSLLENERLVPCIITRIHIYTGFPGGSVVKNPPAMQETWEMQAQSLGRENPLQEEMATHFSILAAKSHRQRSVAGYSPGVTKNQTQLSN